MNGWKENTCILCSHSKSYNISMEKLLSILESVKWQPREYLLFEREIVCGCFVFKLYTYPWFTNTDLRLNMPLINQINCLDSSFTTLRFLNYSKNKSCPQKILFYFSIFATDYSFLIRYRVYYTITIIINPALVYYLLLLLLIWNRQ